MQGGGDLRAELLPLAQGVRRPSGRSSQEDEGSGARERSAAPARRRPFPREAGAGGRCLGKFVAPERRRQAVDGIREKYGLSERHACRIVGQHRGTQRYVPTVLADEDALTQAMIALASEYGRYGYRRVTALLQAAGWQVGKDRVQRIWRREGLKVPSRHRPRSRLWLNDGSCVRLRPLHRNHVWSFDFVQAQTHDGRSLRILTLIDEHSRACLALKVARRINSVGVIEALADAMCLHGIPEHIRCDNGPEMISKALRKWVAKAGSQIQYIAPGSPWENGDLREL